MSIENKIKEAFKKDERLSEAVGKWDPDKQPNIYELNNFLRKSGYRLLDVLAVKDTTIPEIILEPLKAGYLYPEIQHYTKEGKFYIKVIDHGMLESSDVEGMITGYENALAVVKHLESLDLHDMEVEEDEE